MDSARAFSHGCPWPGSLSLRTKPTSSSKIRPIRLSVLTVDLAMPGSIARMTFTLTPRCAANPG